MPAGGGDVAEAEKSFSSYNSRKFIQEGHLVLFKLPNGGTKSVKVMKNTTIAFGRFGSFNTGFIIGHPYGLSYEIIDKKLRLLPAKPWGELEEDSNATNEMINDKLDVQLLTSVEIEALKESGMHASEIINRQIEQHANYSLKTEYSKEKYKKRKEAKFLKSFTTVEPTVHNVCDYWFQKDRNRIREIRSDALSQMMNLAGIRPGGRYIVVDEASGLVVSAVLERLGGVGKVLTICDVDSPPAYPIMAHMNFDEDMVKATLSSLNWATADKAYDPVLPPIEPTSGVFRSERQEHRLSKRKSVMDALFTTRDDFFSGEFDGLVVASDYDPFLIVQKLCPYMTGSSSIVIHSPHLQVVSEVQARMRTLPEYLGPSITEGWLRRYQVLPGRTHPVMITTGSGGYILHTIRVYDDPAASAIAIRHGRHKKHSERPDTNSAQFEAKSSAD